MPLLIGSHEQWYNVSLVLDWNLEEEETKSKCKSPTSKKDSLDEETPVRLDKALNEVFEQPEGKYYFGIFLSKQDKIHVAAFRKISNTDKSLDYDSEWQIFDPRFRSAIGL